VGREREEEMTAGQLQGNLTPPAGPRLAAGPAARFLRLIVSDYFGLLLCIVYFLCAWPFVPELADADNVANLFVGMLPLLAVAIGQTLVLITGGIDLSVIAVIGACGVLAAAIMNQRTGWLAGHALAIPTAIAAALLLGTLIGLLNGVAVTLLRMPAFIVTLSMKMCLGGIVLWLTRSMPIGNLPESFAWINYGRPWGITPALIIVALLAILVQMMLSLSLPGRWLYAVGQNPRASRVSGVPVTGVVIAAYAACSFCVAVGAILLTARLETGSPKPDEKMLLDVIGAAVIGGTSLLGGKGKVLWTVYGVLLFALISNTLQLLGVQHFRIMIIKGAVILLAAGTDLLRGRLLERL
jgi:ribose/xylose/arabinose/galactoside ABC-type transport system permease subunit